MGKRWTEKEAWLYLAKRWDLAAGHSEYDYGTVMARILSVNYEMGICDCISDLNFAGHITQEQAESMDKKKNTYDSKYKRENGWFWPTNKKGAEKRANFCRRMAKKCKEDE